MSTATRWTLGVVILVAVGGLLVREFLARRADMAREREREQPVKVPPRVSRGSAGEILVTLDRETQQRIALRVEPLAESTLRPEAVAYGRLQEDPAESFTLRAPVAGILRLAAGRPWPNIGEMAGDRAVVAAIEPRLSPAERVDLQARLAAARADVEAFTASVSAARAAFDRTRALNAEDKNLSDRALQEAEARWKGEEARLHAATDTARLVEASLSAGAGLVAPAPLALERGGEVVEIFARLGEAIESGQPVLRVARFDRLLARVDLPAGETTDPSVSAARIVPVGYDNRSLPAQRATLAAAVDPRTQGLPFLFRLAASGLPLRPGMAVKAYLVAPGQNRKGVIIPRPAVVRLGGKAWTYVQLSEDRFTRREVPTDYPAGNGWLASAGFSAGERVVSSGGQVLLSEEFKSQIQIGEESERREE